MTDPARPQPFFVRFSGLPASELEELTPRGAWRVAQEILALDETLAADAEEIGSLLHAVVGALGESPLRPRLVALRRRVHRGRVPAKGEWSDELADALPAEVSERIRQWLVAIGRREAATRELAAAVSDDLREEARALHKVASDPLFRHALSQASPALLDELLRAETAGGVAMKRRTMIGLTKFISRATTKTSPYSTFTATAAGRWVTGEQPFSSGSDEMRCVVELDRMVLDQLVNALLEDDAFVGSLHIRVNPSLRVTGDTLVFLGRRPAESLVSLPRSRELHACLALVGGGCPVAQLISGITELAGGRRASAASFVQRLTRIGLLEHVLPMPDQSDRPLEQLIEALQAASGPRSAIVTGMLQELRSSLLRDIPLTELQEFRAQQRAVAERLTAIGAVLGLDWPAADVMSKIATHENAVFPDADLALSRSQWQPLLDDLDVLRRWLALHDRMLPVRIALAEYVRRRFGTAEPVDFVALHAFLQADLARPEDQCPDWLVPLRPFLQLSTPVPAEQLRLSPVPELALLHVLRQESLATATCGDLRDGVVSVDPETLTRLAATWPAWVRSPASVACYLQPMTADGELRAVVNTISGGYGKGRGRWTRLIAQAGGAVATVDGPGGGPGPAPSPAVAEMAGNFGVSVNLRAATARYEIDYPFTTSERPPEQRIPLNDLVVGFDESGERLEVSSASRGLPIQPAHLGMMADPLLPPAARLLFAAFGQSYLLHPSLALLRPATEEETAEPRFLPRVEIGRAVVRRAEWSAPVGLVPTRVAGETDAAHLLRLAAWLRDNGIPDRCFLRLEASGGDWVSRVFVKSRKPMYLDFSSMSMLTVFEHMLKGFEGRVVLEEALPDPLDVPAFVCGRPRATEFVIEIDAREAR
jgi:hypothetical protein